MRQARRRLSSSKTPQAVNGRHIGGLSCRQAHQALACTALLAVLLLAPALSQQGSHHNTRISRILLVDSSSSTPAAGASSSAPARPVGGILERLDPLACVPQLLVIGAMKGGTTAMFSYLNGSRSQPGFHRAFAGSFKKEPKLFTRVDPRAPGAKAAAVDAYFKHTFAGVAASDDPLAGRCSHPAALGLTPASRPALVRFEATAMNLAHPAVAQRVAATLPMARLVVLLREPVSRLLSHVNMHSQAARSAAGDLLTNDAAMVELETLSTLRRQMAHLKACFAAAQRSRTAKLHEVMDNCAAAHFSARSAFVYSGLYGLHLARWFDALPPQQMLLWSSKAFSAAPAQHLMQLVEWLGLDPAAANTRTIFAPVHKRTYNAHLPAAFVDELAAFHEPFNRLLFDVLVQHGFAEHAAQLRRDWADPVGALAAARQAAGGGGAATFH